MIRSRPNVFEHEYQNKHTFITVANVLWATLDRSMVKVYMDGELWAIKLDYLDEPTALKDYERLLQMVDRVYK